MSKRYFYGRVSAKDQNLARQIESAKQYKNIDRVFKDKQSGKDFDRDDYHICFCSLRMSRLSSTSG